MLALLLFFLNFSGCLYLKRDATVRSEPVSEELDEVTGEKDQIQEAYENYIMASIAMYGGFPEEARKAGLSGIVILEATIDIYGRVIKIKILRGEHDLLNEAAVEALKQWVYEPFLLDGKPMPVKFTVTVQFNLR